MLIYRGRNGSGDDHDDKVGAAIAFVAAVEDDNDEDEDDECE